MEPLSPPSHNGGDVFGLRRCHVQRLGLTTLFRATRLGGEGHSGLRDVSSSSKQVVDGQLDKPHALANRERFKSHPSLRSRGVLSPHTGPRRLSTRPLASSPSALPHSAAIAEIPVWLLRALPAHRPCQGRNGPVR